jgi:hypothetical protein
MDNLGLSYLRVTNSSQSEHGAGMYPMTPRQSQGSYKVFLLEYVLYSLLYRSIARSDVHERVCMEYGKAMAVKFEHQSGMA